MSTIQQNLQDVRNRIAAAAQNCARAPEKLLCLQSAKPNLWRRSKKPSPPASAFGENYVQEGVDKIRHFAESPQNGELVWHFIGPLQSNKSRLVAEHFAWCHTVDRLRIAQRLSDQRPAACRRSTC